MSELTKEQLIKLYYLKEEANEIALNILNQDISIAEASRFLADIAERIEEVKKS